MKHLSFSGFLAALILWACFFTPVASYCHGAQATIIGIEVNGLKTMSEAEFLGKIKIKKGDVFSRKAVSEDVRRLADEEGIIVHAVFREGPDGVVVVFNVIAEHVGDEIVEVEFKRGPRADLEDVVRVRRGSRFVEHILRSDANRIRNYFIEKGYAHVIVRPKVEKVSKGKVKVTFEITKGPKFQLKKLEFVGNKGLSRSDLVAFMETKVDTWLTSRRFVRRAFDEDIARLNTLYEWKGYLDASVELDTISMDPETGRVEAVIKITEGSRYKIVEVRFEGNEAASDKELLGVIRLQQDQFYSVEARQADVAALRRYYTTGKRGYASVSVKSLVKKAEQPNTLILTFSIQEGKRTYIRRIETSGNYKTRKKVIVREMRIAPGDLYDLDLNWFAYVYCLS